MCKVTCRHPRTVPGRCCPVCDVSDCDVACRHGYRTDGEGNPLCECLSADEVARNPPRCRSMAGCRKRCPHGFKVDANGCERCKCKRCRKLKSCSLSCAGGLAVNERGCPECRCRLEEAPPTAAGLSCVTPDGAMHAEGEAWHDGCRQCYCHAGVELCAVIACPVPSCDHPEIRSGQCCPTCADAAEPAAHHPNTTVCQAVDGGTYADGQSWRLDACTRCLCRAGRVLCSVPQCPAAAACQSCRCEDGVSHCFHERCPSLACTRPVLMKGSCCPDCLEPPETSSCVYNNRTLEVGQTLAVDACKSCTCEAGVVVCARKVCSVACDNPVPVPGQCCPVCKDESSSRRNYHFLNGTSKVAHRTRVPAPDAPTQTSRPGVHRQSGGSRPTLLHIVLYAVLACVLLLVAAVVLWCVCHRRRSVYTPKHERADEKKPLNGPQTLDLAHLNGAGGPPNACAQDRPAISVIRHT
ncbi:cysteine-rich motor neuron 1 protein-like [Pollicipes pollicipes]|uniref:cysteine-rich motor neuron 1 protein-like n=1 Tax=Pollicipes pollicipes TaxID=41117 RepID=UPI0018849537|nr:cysteine-rich motor neuron 1 protein-like [Pollicipes pollicipes]